MIVCVARFKSKMNCLQALKQSLQELVPLTMGEEGCIAYILTEEIFYQGSHSGHWDIALHEKWKDRSSFEHHCQQSYIKNFFDNISPLYVEESDVRLYETVH